MFSRFTEIVNNKKYQCGWTIHCSSNKFSPCSIVCLGVSCVHACSVSQPVSNSLRPRGLQPARFLCPWESPGKNTGVDYH